MGLLHMFAANVDPIATRAPSHNDTISLILHWTVSGVAVLACLVVALGGAQLAWGITYGPPPNTARVLWVLVGLIVVSGAAMVVGILA